MAAGLASHPAEASALAEALAQAVAPAEGVGLALIGPFADEGANDLTFIAGAWAG
ncbi:MAG: hypothetical protein U0401_10195 [Anaerolineae bacterium]